MTRFDQDPPGEYLHENGKAYWVNPDGTCETYKHQDGNFSNLCCFIYCRCRD